MAAPNVFNTSTITSDSAVQAVGTSATAIITNSSSSGEVYMVKSLYVSNIHASATGTITADVFRSSVAYRLCNAVPLAINTSLVIVSAEAPVFLLEGDTLRLTADAGSKFEAIASYDILSE